MSNRVTACILLAALYIFVGVKMNGTPFNFLIAGFYYILGYIGSNINK